MKRIIEFLRMVDRECLLLVVIAVLPLEVFLFGLSGSLGYRVMSVLFGLCILVDVLVLVWVFYEEIRGKSSGSSSRDE